MRLKRVLGLVVLLVSGCLAMLSGETGRAQTLPANLKAPGFRHTRPQRTGRVSKARTLQGAAAGARSGSRTGTEVSVMEGVEYSFCSSGGSCPDGTNVKTSLIQDFLGYLAGTTASGGDGGNGTIFITGPGDGDDGLAASYDFCAAAGCLDGAVPQGQLVQGSDGNMYGVTAQGGANTAGTAFGLSLFTGGLTTLYNFCASAFCVDGSGPTSPLIAGSDGAFYGVTGGGGANGEGVLYKVTASGDYTKLHDFCAVLGCTDGAVPAGGLVEFSDGKFYGTSSTGGASSAGNVFSLSADGSTFATVYDFCALSACADGSTPQTALIEGSDGNLYGVTSAGGANGDGSIFQLTTAGVLTTLYSFCAQFACADGSSPMGALLLAGDGNFYGTTNSGGTFNEGTLYQVTSTGAYTVLDDFCVISGCPDGQNPQTTLLPTTDGGLWGSTNGGGAYGQGEIFGVYTDPELVPGLIFTGPSTGKRGVPLTIGYEADALLSLTLQQCSMFAFNEYTGDVYVLGNVAGTLSGGVFSGSVTVTPPKVGVYLASVTCGGTQSDGAAIEVPPVPTTLTVTASSSTLVSGQPGSFTVAVVSEDSAVVAEGSVTVQCGSATYGPQAVIAGSATLPASTAGGLAETYSCVATYSDPLQTYASSSGSVGVTLTKESSTVALSSERTSYAEGDPVTLTATVTGQYTQANAGTVTFSSDNVVLGRAAVNASGVASISFTADYAPATYTVYATYSGTGSMSGSSTSGQYTQTSGCSVRGVQPAC